MKVKRKLFRKIKTLYTLAGVRAKDGLRLKPEDLDPVSNGAMLVEDERIVWSGEEKKVRRALRDLDWPARGHKDIELNLETVMPAFIDPHTHLVFAGDRKNEFELRNQGISYQEIAARGGGIKSTVRETRLAREKDLLAVAQSRADRLLAQGVTTVEIKSGYGLNEKDEIKILQVANKIKNMRVVATYLGPHATPEGVTSDDYLDEIISSTLPKVRKLAARADMFVESGFFSMPQARRYFEAARALGFALTAHADQLTRTGAAVELARLHAHSVDHCVQISDNDIRELSRLAAHTTCVCLPTSDFYLKMKYPPARSLIDAGARVALATDFNPGTSPTLDLSLVGVLARLEMRMSLAEVIAGLTFNAARALGLAESLGALTAGYEADFIGLNTPIDALFYDVGFHPVSDVYSWGRRVTSSKNLKLS